MSIETRSLGDPERSNMISTARYARSRPDAAADETLPKFNLLEASIGAAPSSPGAWARQRRLQNL
jgi:hypothetical protein